VNAILRTVLQRLGLGVLTLIVVSAIISGAMAMLPSDFAQSILGQAATPETVKVFREEIGLDKSPIVRYVDWLGGIVQGDFGKSYAGAGSLSGNRREVAELIAPRLWNTLFLASMTAIAAVPLALVLGMLAALYRNSLFDRTINVVTLTAVSSPEFFLAYVLMVFFVSQWHIFPSLAKVDATTPFFERIYRCALPSLTLLLVIVAQMMRMTRAAIINLLSSPYIEMARLKGIAPRQIILHHALPNAWAPIANVIALNLAYLVVGVVIVEAVFVYPGIGKLMVDSVIRKDLPVVQGCALIFAATYILLNLAADIVAIVTNPRLLHPR
jgi:peptide/nickel transport system permease protein